MKLNRRQFAAGSLTTLAFAGLAGRAMAAAETYRNEVEGYGPLLPDPAGFFDLPRGFRYSVISSAGEAMDDGFVTPGNFDGMACFPLDARRVALVRNHELKPAGRDRGPAGGLQRLEKRLAESPFYSRDNEGRVLPGGTSTIVYDLRSRLRESQYLSLAGTAVNCAGGPTPWGSWLTCEETTIRPGEVERDHGWVFDVPARQRGLLKPEPLTRLGRFKHEAAAVEPATGIIYLTEDRDDSLFYRFVPERSGELRRGGKLQALSLRDEHGADTRNWNGIGFEPGSTRTVRWVDLDETHSPNDDLRLRGHSAGAALFARGEGIHRGNGEYYFTCTSGGAAKIGQIMRYVPSAYEGRPEEGREPARLQLFVESRDPLLLDYADNLTVTPWGHLILCEDKYVDDPVNHLKGVTPEGRIYTLARLKADTELAGVCFSADGSTMFVNAYHPGRTLAITGPWSSFQMAVT
ncbi:MAG TPA: alkaline phosphatase PhoX [Allosphingosinicella sp.]|uniref:alkaline phosphatase PhoX n=1 Tax=Allosphingosinicella sp. TaxID=2823234 RepID=UPI002ED97242